MQNHTPLQQTDSEDDLDDLQFMTSVDTSFSQNVPMPSQHPQMQQGNNDNDNDNNTMGNQMDNLESGQITAAPAPSSSAPYGIQMLNGSAHPVACIFHCIFKFLALFLYIFNGLFFSNNKGVNFITITVCCITFLAMDFWVVKNVTGRLLVGLRWWNKVADDDDGKTEWIFESAAVTRKNAVDNSIFWTVLYGTPVVWGVLCFVALIKLHFGWMITVILGLSLSVANVYGYWKCSSDQKAKFQRMMARGAEMGTMAMVRNNFFGYFSRGSQPSQTQASASATYS